MDVKKDIVWINNLKAFCIIIVYLRHCELYYGVNMGCIDLLFLTFYVNGFFFASGYLLFWKQLSTPKIDEHKSLYISRNGSGFILASNILFRIVLPSIIFAAIEFLPSCLIQGREISIGYALFKTIGGGTYWFTSALVVGEVIILLLLCTRIRNVLFYVIISFLLTGVGLLIVSFYKPENGLWAWHQGLICLFFMAFGGIYWKYEHYIDRIIRSGILFPLVVIYIILVIFLKDFTNPLISTLEIQPLAFLTSTIACFLLVSFCKILGEWYPLTYIGRNSLGFYFMSGALPIIVSRVFHSLFDTYGWLLPLTWIVCIIVAYITVIIINMWLPLLFDLRRTKRIQYKT